MLQDKQLRFLIKLVDEGRACIKHNRAHHSCIPVLLHSLVKSPHK